MWNVVDSLDDDIDNFWFNSIGGSEGTCSLCLSGVLSIDPPLVTGRTCRFPVAARQGGRCGVGW